MKIVHLTQYLHGGMYHEWVLPKYHARAGHETHIIVSKIDYVDNDDFSKENYFVNDGVHIHRLDHYWNYKKNFALLKSLNAKLDELAPDIVFNHFIHVPSVVNASRYVSKHKGTKLIVDNHADYYNSGNTPYAKEIYYGLFWRTVHKLFCRNISMCWSVTQDSVRFANNLIGIDPSISRFLPMGVDTSIFYPDIIRRVAKRAELGIADDDVVVVTAGKLEPRKNTDMLIESILRQDNKNLKAFIIGPTSEAYMEQMKATANDDERIHFFANQSMEALSDLYRASDIAAFPGTQSVLWQQAVGSALPMIVMQWPGIEYMVNDKNGIVLDHPTVENLSVALKKLAQNKAMRLDMAKSAMELVKSELDYEVLARKSIDI